LFAQQTGLSRRAPTPQLDQRIPDTMLETGRAHTGISGARLPADYMETPAFENTPRRSHVRRSGTVEVPPVADRRRISGQRCASIEVFELSSMTRAQPHRMTPFARVEGTRVSYAGVLEPRGVS